MTTSYTNSNTNGNGNTNDKVFILLSGGIDSTCALAMAKTIDFPQAEFEAVSIDYGQRHDRELQAAKEVCAFYDIPHVIIDAKGFMAGMLVDKGEQNEEIPNVSYDELPKGISPTYVTFRNGLMLSILAARAQAWVMAQQKADAAYQQENPEGFDRAGLDKQEYNAYIYCGIHADDGANWAYPDCTQEFIGPMSAAIYIGTYNRVRVRAPFTFMPKSMLTAIGVQQKAPLEKTWSCYVGGEKHCGVCPTCRSRKDAFRDVKRMGLITRDPTEYMQ